MVGAKGHDAIEINYLPETITKHFNFNFIQFIPNAN